MKPKHAIEHKTDKLVRDIKRVSRRKFGAEEKIRIVLAGLRGEDRFAELCPYGQTTPPAFWFLKHSSLSTWGWALVFLIGPCEEKSASS